MRRNGIVDGRGDPCSDCRSQFTAVGTRRLRYRQLVRRLIRAHVIQPHDVTIAVIELRTAVIMRSELVRLEVSVRDAARVIGVRFVHMFGRKRRRQGQQGRQNDRDHEPAERMKHA